MVKEIATPIIPFVSVIIFLIIKDGFISEKKKIFFFIYELNNLSHVNLPKEKENNC